MKRIKLYLPIVHLFLFVLLMMGCSPSPPSVTTVPSVQPTVTLSPVSIPTISTPDAYNLIQKNKGNPDFIIIDVRTAEEFNSGHIANSINIDYSSADFKDTVDKLDRNKEYLIYCRSGARSTAATQIMLNLGFSKIHNLSGGIIQWVQDGYSTVN